MGSLLFESAGRCAALIRSKQLSPVELTKAVLAQIEAFNPALNAFVSVNERAIEQAQAAETAVMRGRPLGPLHGVPFSAKDNVDVRGMATTLGLKSLAGNIAAADAPTAYLARAAGAICIGKTALPELGWDSATESPLSGITRTPWDLSLSAGGSSGGAGAALAAGMAPLAIATDGGGSIRQPASFNGVVGFKATAGLVPAYPPSRFGPIGHFGPMARNVEDVALLLDVIAGADPRIEGSLERGFAAACAGRLAPCRIGYAPSINTHAVDAEVSAVVEQWVGGLRDLGATVEQIDLKVTGLEQVWEALYFGATAKAYEALPAQAKTDLSAEFAAFLERASRITGEEGVKAELQRHDIIRQVHRATRQFDAIVMPTTSTVAFPADRQERASTTNKIHAHGDLFRLTQIWNLTGQPALSLPAGWTDAGLPVGVQIVGLHGQDALVLRVAKAAERSWPDKRPALLQ